MAWDDEPPPQQTNTAAAPSSWDAAPPTSQELETTKPIMPAESFLRGAANNFPLAPQAIAGGEALFGNKGYSENLADWNAKAASAKQQNPKSYGVGAVGGAIAPLLIPGVGEALEAAPIAGNALYGAANAVSNTDLLKNPGQAAKQALIGGTIGGTVGKIGQKVGSMFTGAADAMEPAANRITAQTTANALDINPRALYKLAERAKDNPENIALEINDKAQKLIPDLVGYGDTAGSKFQKVLNAHDAASDAIGKVIQATDKNLTEMPEVNSMVANLDKAASRYKGLEFQDSVQSKAILDDTKKMLEGLQKEGQLTFQNLSLVKQEIGQIYHNPNNIVRGVDQAYGIVSDGIDSILDRVSVADPTLKPMYNQAKEVFKFSSDLLPAMSRGVAREVAGKSGGLTNAALGAGAVFGHPLEAGAAYAAKTAAHLGFPELAQNVAYKSVNALRNSNLPGQIANAAPKVARGAQQELIDYLTSKYGNNQ